ncbi:MAG: hypothetical protein RMJ38_05945 [candidate division WOR-3 bacterium]|nr:hypothetical protein [candidate division WOR-3 bacterium]MDW8150965.1 hypothetical protein [candidate division WOR-3 bacterium]
MVWILRFINISLLILAIWALFYNLQLLKTIFILCGFLFLISGIRKAFQIGLDSIRGKFWVLLSMSGLIFPVSEMINSQTLHLISRFYLSLVLLFMFVGLRRQGFELRGVKIITWVLGVALSLLFSFLISAFIESRLINYLFLLVLNVNFAILLADVLLYIGSDLGRRWFVGFAGFSFFFVGDPLYLLGYDEITRFFWFLIFFFINIVAHIED